MDSHYVPGEDTKEKSPSQMQENSEAVLLDPLSALKKQTEKERKTLESLSEQTEEQIVAKIKQSLKQSDNPYETEIDTEMIVVEDKDILDDDMLKNKEMRNIRQSIVYDPDREDLFQDFNSSSSSDEIIRETAILEKAYEPNIAEEEKKEQEEA